MLQKIKPKKFKLGIVGGGPGSWIGHVHRISSRYDDKYEIVAGVFSRSVDKSRKFGQSIGLDKSRCYSNYKEMSEKEAKRKARTALAKKHGASDEEIASATHGEEGNPANPASETISV